MPTAMKTDIGIFSEEYSADTLDFNTDSFFSESFSRDATNDVFFTYYFELSLNQQTYFRKNEKFYQLAGNFGGMINILFIVGRILCYTYNLLVLKHQLINISFENLEKKEKSQGSE